MKKFNLKQLNIIKRSQQSMQLSHSTLVNTISSGNEASLSNFLYTSITTRPNWKQDYNNLSITKEMQDAYIRVTKTSTKGNSAWSQFDVLKGLQQGQGDWKIYFTPSNEDVFTFINAIPDLSQYLKPIADKYQMNLDYKVPTTLTGFIGINDRLVLHFSNKSAIEEIKQAVSQWASSIGISFGNRTHNVGQDSENDGSWTERICQDYASKAIQYFNTGQWSADQIAQWIEQNLQNSLSQLS